VCPTGSSASRNEGARCDTPRGGRAGPDRRCRRSRRRERKVLVCSSRARPPVHDRLRQRCGHSYRNNHPGDHVQGQQRRLRMGRRLRHACQRLQVGGAGGGWRVRRPLNEARRLRRARGGQGTPPRVGGDCEDPDRRILHLCEHAGDYPGAHGGRRVLHADVPHRSGERLPCHHRHHGRRERRLLRRARADRVRARHALLHEHGPDHGHRGRRG